MTRFGQISALWQNFKRLWQNFKRLWQNFKRLWLLSECLFCLGQSFEPNWANFHDIAQIFIVVNGPIFKR